jgi:transcriptional regulator with XRE-family HTH domain
MSQTDLENRSGIPKARISRYENGHVIPSIPSLRQLAGALGVKLGSLLD